jgi:Ser-tRNA(Ala) deacylase AlaX
LDQSAFYPTSGGQIHDIGKLILSKDGLTVESATEEIQEALEAHGASRGIDALDMMDKVTDRMEKADQDPAYRAKLVKYLNKHATEEYEVVDVVKVGKVVMHILDKEVGEIEGCKVHGIVD